MTGRSAGLLALLAAIWGGSYLLIKYGLEGFSAAELVFLRSALAGALLWAVIAGQGAAARRALRDAARRWPLALGIGALQVAVPFLLIGYGERVVPSGLTAVLIAPSPIFVALAAPALDRSERIGGIQAVGLGVGLAGVALLVGLETVHSLDQFLGAIGIVAAAACYGLATFMVKGPYARVPAIATSAISLVAAALITLPLAVLSAKGAWPGSRALLATVALGVLGTALAFVIYYHLINEIGAGRASLVSYLTPPLALGYGALLLSERVGVGAVAGLVLILSGVALASGRMRPGGPPREHPGPALAPPAPPSPVER